MLVLMDRRDEFAAVMSNILVWRTKQATHYASKPAPLEVLNQEFFDMLAVHRSRVDRIDKHRGWAEIHKFWYEDILHDHEKFTRALELQFDDVAYQQNKYLLHNVAPYNYRELIVNHEQLWEYYREIKNQPLFDADIIDQPNQMLAKETFQ